MPSSRAETRENEPVAKPAGSAVTKSEALQPILDWIDRRLAA
jgi:hypothetical protein